MGGAGAGVSMQGVSMRVGGGAAGCRDVGAPSACAASGPAAAAYPPSSAPASAPPPSPASVPGKGVRVRICGLVARPELNGCIAEVVGPLAQGGRVPVRILLPAQFAGQGVKLKPANVKANYTLFDLALSEDDALLRAAHELD